VNKNSPLTELYTLLNQLQMAPDAEKEMLRQQAEQAINDLIQQDFNRLVQLLYRVDVPEQKLKDVLQQQPERDAASIITGLIVSRLEEKARSRRQFTHQNHTEDDAERW